MSLLSKAAEDVLAAPKGAAAVYRAVDSGKAVIVVGASGKRYVVFTSRAVRAR